MAVKYREIISAINEIAPPELAQDWDNCGTQVYTGKEYIEKVLVCLEVTNAVIDEAEKLGVDFILTHHPLLFSPMRKVDNNEFIGSLIVELIKNEISVYSAHTNFDTVLGGNNTKLCEILGLRVIGRLIGANESPERTIGRIAEFKEPISLDAAAKLVQDKLDLPPQSIRIVGEKDRMIKRVGVCTGAGADLMNHCLTNNCDAFITGDVKYHDAQHAKEMNLAVIDAGHFGTEYIFSDNMATQLRKKIHDVEIIVSKANVDPFTYI